MAELIAAQSDVHPDPMGVYRGDLSNLPTYHEHHSFAAMKAEGSRNGRHPNRFAICAYPKRYGKRDRDTFIVDQSRVIWRKDLGGRAAGEFPEDPAAEGWSRPE